MEIVKLIDQDRMTLEEAQAVVDEAHKHGMKVVAHSHRPDEIRVGLKSQFRYIEPKRIARLNQSGQVRTQFKNLAAPLRDDDIPVRAKSHGRSRGVS